MMQGGSVKGFSGEGRMKNRKQVLSDAGYGRRPERLRALAEDLADAARGGGSGTVWTLEGSEDLNANLVRLPEGGRIGEHVNLDVDVLVVGVSGYGTVEVEGRRHEVSPGRVVFLPKGIRRSISGGEGGVAYLSVHRRKGPLGIGRARREA
jgi:quercetin dioxygenase-like cupin family protein